VEKITSIYCRVSSRDQSHASQLPDLERWAEAHGGPVAWCKDTFTGRSMNRPGMDRLMDQLRAGQLERIVVWRLDRLGRTTKGLCQLFDELTERKVDLVSLKDGFSLASPAGRLHARILASVAEYETEIRAERVAAGQAVARRNGKKWGGSKKGWRWKVSDDQQAAILEMHGAGRPITQIARITGLSRPSVYRLLKQSGSLARQVPRQSPHGSRTTAFLVEASAGT
jgi:DNA invertase Pin-like site-specific DNA recombinase